MKKKGIATRREGGGADVATAVKRIETGTPRQHPGEVSTKAAGTPSEEKKRRPLQRKKKSAWGRRLKKSTGRKGKETSENTTSGLKKAAKRRSGTYFPLRITSN